MMDWGILTGDVRPAKRVSAVDGQPVVCEVGLVCLGVLAELGLIVIPDCLTLVKLRRTDQAI